MKSVERRAVDKEDRHLEDGEMKFSNQNRRCGEETGDVKMPQSESSSSIAVPAAVRDGKGDDDDGQNLIDNTQAVLPTFPVDTLVEEIGLKIFEMLDGTDLASCFRTFPNWNQWLMPQRAQFIFPEVAPFLLKWLPKTALLECRKVSRTWKEGLDNAYSLHPERLQISFQKQASRMPELVNHFYFADDIQRFLNEMEFHPGNPFVGRTISVHWIDVTGDEILGQLDEYRDVNYFWNNVNRLLDRFGQHVYFFNIGLLETDFIPVEEILRNCLLRLPNLRKLEITAEQVISSVRIQEYYRVNPLPQLLHLQTLEINAPGFLTKAILDSSFVSDNIKQLAFSDNVHENVSGFYEAVYNFKKLMTLDAMKNIRVNNISPLRLCVDNTENATVDFQWFFTTLKLLVDSLETAVIRSIDADETVFSMDDFKISLSKSKPLIVFMYWGPLDPFLQVTSPGYLEILLAVWRRWKSSTVIIQWFDPVKKSYILTMLPTLETLMLVSKEQDGWRWKFMKIEIEDEIWRIIECEKVNGKESEVEGVETYDGNESESDEKSGCSFWFCCM